MRLLGEAPFFSVFVNVSASTAFSIIREGKSDFLDGDSEKE